MKFLCMEQLGIEIGGEIFSTAQKGTKKYGTRYKKTKITPGTADKQKLKLLKIEVENMENQGLHNPFAVGLMKHLIRTILIGI